MGVINDGYYYPDPEEITLGYICQVNWSRGYSEIFDDYSPKIKKGDGCYCDDIMNLVHLMDDGCIEVRVPLLSKEDIESLGWKPDIRNVWRIESVVVKWFIKYDESGHNIHIQYMLTDYGITAYVGPCPTINDLKYLMNLLKISDANKTGD